MGVLMRIFDSNSKGMMNVYIYLCVIQVLIWELYLTELYFKDTRLFKWLQLDSNLQPLSS